MIVAPYRSVGNRDFGDIVVSVSGQLALELLDAIPHVIAGVNVLLKGLHRHAPFSGEVTMKWGLA